MAVDVSKLIITQIDQIMAFNNANELEFVMDELTDATISNSEDRVDITGKGGRIIGSLKRNKSVTISGTNGLLVGGALAAQTGTEIEQGTYAVRMSEIIVVNSNAATITQEAVGTTGAEVQIYVKNPNGSCGQALEQVASSPTTGQYTYTPAGKALAFFDGDYADGTELIAIYDAEVESAKISNDSEKYSKTLRMYIDVTAQDNCDNEYHGQFYIPRADFSGTFDLTFGNDPTTHAFEATALAGGCTGSTNLWDFIVFE